MSDDMRDDTIDESDCEECYGRVVYANGEIGSLVELTSPPDAAAVMGEDGNIRKYVFSRKTYAVIYEYEEMIDEDATNPSE